MVNKNVQITDNGTFCSRGSDSFADSTLTRVSELEQRIVCSGQNSCWSSMITNTGDVYCEGHLSCTLSSITTKETVYCLGCQSCGYASNTIFNAQQIWCLGYLACEGAKIHTQGAGNVYHIYYIMERSQDLMVSCIVMQLTNAIYIVMEE
eukprot:205791_1